MATFGHTTDNNDFDSTNWSNYKAACRFQLTESNATVSKLTVQCKNGAVSGTAIKGIIYTDKAGPLPDALQATTDELAVASGAAEAWRDLTFATPPVLAAGWYWLGVICNGNCGSFTLCNVNTGGTGDYASDTYSDGAANPWGAENNSWDDEMLIYATYTTAPTAPVLSASQHAGGVAHIDLSWS